MKQRRKYPNTSERIAQFRTAWNHIDPDASFAGMTLAEFEARVAPVKENAELIQTLAASQAAALTQRRQVNDDAREVLRLVVNAVRGNPQHGEDSRLYRALGYVPIKRTAQRPEPRHHADGPRNGRSCLMSIQQD